MARNHSMRIGLSVAALILVTLIVAFNVFNLAEAFGDGAPYYGRTTNMDKWSDPVPVLAAVDAIYLVTIALFVYFSRRKR